MANSRTAGLLIPVVLLGIVSRPQAEERRLNLVRDHRPSDTLRIRETGENEYEWSLPDGLGQRLDLDLGRLGVDPNDYDELRFEIKPQGSQVGLHATLYGMPTENELTSWYAKFRTATDAWSTGRFDLRVDDDGAQYPERFGDFEPGVLRFELYPRRLGLPGEPQWRKAILRNPRLIKWAVAVDFDPRDVRIVTAGDEISFTYPLRLENRTDRPLEATVEIDPEQGLEHFKAEPHGTVGVGLAAGEAKIVPIRLFMAAADAAKLPPAHAERICPRVSVAGLPGSDVQPLLGYRNWHLWAVVPVRHEPVTPAAFQARVAASGRHMNVETWKTGVLRRADAVLEHDWPAFDWLTPGLKPNSPVPFYGQSYRCPDCTGQKLRADPPNGITRHVCDRCRKVFENDPKLDQCARQEYFAGRFADVRTLATAWLLSGADKYADKAITIMLAYADAHPTMTVSGDRSTGGSSRLGKNTLIVSWSLPALAEGYALLEAYPGLEAAARKRIDEFLIDAAVRQQRHGCEFNNQQAEHLRSYASVALATGFWPLLGEAVHGDFGWHQMVDHGYSEDGIGNEGQAYHMASWQAQNHLAKFALERGLDLMTPRFKRVYDGSLAMGYGSGEHYELAYRVFKDPSYLGKINARRQYAGEDAILAGVPAAPPAESVPAVSKLLDGQGYIFLRRGNAADSWEIHLNYKEQFDRTEADRFTTFFYRNGGQVDGTVGRLSYTVPGGGWMYATAAHNLIVIDGGDSRATVGELLAYQGDGETPHAVVADSPPGTLYEGVRQLRAIALLGDAYVVFDRVVCEQPRTIDRYQWGKGRPTFAFKTEPATPAGIPKAGRFQEIEGGGCGKELRLDFANGLKMRLVSDHDLTGYKAVSFGGYLGNPMEVTWARVDDAREASFLAAFSYGADAEPPAVRIVKSTADEIVVEVTGKDKTRTLTIRPRQKQAAVAVP